ncbi:MAG: hypothetical protein HOI08_01170 [Flavobacteriaceae bacterium]|jgi:antitoxin component YwqK of YwqJK toxin-antitoxin module|nr:hypothetical protein [Flavobacteriaceae bacterium]
MKKIIYFNALLALSGCTNLAPTVLSDSAIECSKLDNLKEFNLSEVETMMLGDEMFSGECFTLFPDTNQISEIRRFKDGVKNGKWVMFFENGEIYYIGTAKEGKIEGPFEGYYENGALADKGLMKQGRKHGLWKVYTRSGDLKEKTLYENGTVKRTNSFD